MIYIKNLERALDYIELNLHSDIDIIDLAREAQYSSFHFQRIFKAFIGDSVKDYIRKRRMTEAGKELVSSNVTVVELAVKYGYQSREGFCRAFLHTFGKAPSRVRRTKQCFALREKLNYEGLVFEYTKWSVGLIPTIRSLGKRYIVGQKFQMKSDGSSFREIPHIWNDWNAQKRTAEINDPVNNDSLGLCIGGDSHSFTYMIGKEVNSYDAIPSGMSLQILESCTYAVFETRGPLVESIQKTTDYIYSQWLSETEYRVLDTHDFEYYYENKGKQCADIYVPIML